MSSNEQSPYSSVSTGGSDTGGSVHGRHASSVVTTSSWDIDERDVIIIGASRGTSSAEEVLPADASVIESRGRHTDDVCDDARNDGYNSDEFENDREGEDRDYDNDDDTDDDDIDDAFIIKTDDENVPLLQARRIIVLVCLLVLLVVILYVLNYTFEFVELSF